MQALQHEGRDELDATTMAAATAGDPRARRAFVQCHQDRVFRLLRRMLRPSGLEHLVDDLAQDAFLRAFAALARFDPDRGPRASTWLLTITTRLAIDALRRHVELARVEPDGTASRRLAADEIAGLEQALGSLPAPQRAALLLREYHGFDYDEIARALGIPEGTVASRIARAKATLRAVLTGGTT